MQRVATYCRVATDEEQSLLRQQNRVHHYCTSKGYDVVLAERDIGSGRTLHHPGMMRLRRAIRADALDVLVVERLDRISRREPHLRNVLSACLRHNVQVEVIEHEAHAARAMNAPS